MMGAFGATAAWLIGGLLVEGPGWEWILFMNVPLGLIALALCPVLLRESRAMTARRSYDPAGVLTIIGALVLLVYARQSAFLAASSWPGSAWCWRSCCSAGRARPASSSRPLPPRRATEKGVLGEPRHC
jgi:MFS family permease